MGDRRESCHHLRDNGVSVAQAAHNMCNNAKGRQIPMETRNWIKDLCLSCQRERCVYDERKN